MSAVIDYMVETWSNTLRQVKRRHEQRKILKLSRTQMNLCHEERDIVDNFEWVPVKELPALYQKMCEKD